ncbi:MAG: class I SAM-dependent methyltransferase family protein [Nanoarchaeota archaeon]|nr:class I SAM-dependent methyltransferase family protein [Nanoarchaeota archaeon]
MKFVKTPVKKAQPVKIYLLENDLFNKDYRFLKDADHVYFPIRDILADGLTRLKKKFTFIEMVEKTSRKIEKIKSLREIVKEKLTEEEFEKVKTAYDIVGSIAILEIPLELEKKEKLISELLLKSHNSIKTVVKKAGGHEGTFRVQKMVNLAGEETTETIHKENSIRLKLDIEKVYFSARLSTERKRIAEMVKPGEDILVMFSGCAPYPCVLARNTKAKHIAAIEINPYGHKYGVDNVALNRLKNVDLYMGDVKKIVPKLKQKFDRIIMPLPHTAEEFLDTAFLAAKKGTIIHLYDFLEEKDIPQKAIEKIGRACRQFKKKYKILNTVKCGQFSPRTYRICVDFVIM